MVVTLQNALLMHKSLLGDDYGNLGRKNWAYLSYDPKVGWGVVKYKGWVGFIQQLLRRIGLFSGTHLNTVFNQIQKESNVPPALLAKITGCWNRQINQMPPVQQVAAPLQLEVVPPAAPPLQLEVVPPAAPPLQLEVAPPAAPVLVSIDVEGTRLTIEEVDITRVQGVKAIVNAANPSCLGGGGIDGVIHREAGPALLAACQALPVLGGNVRCRIGEAVTTHSGRLADRGIEHVIHAVGPVYNPAAPEESAALLANTYISALNAAYELGIQSIAIPAISTGIYGYPFDAATRLALKTVGRYAHRYQGRFTEIKLVHLGDRAAEAAQILHRLQDPEGS